MSNWFGDLNLAYKFAIAFGGLLVITIIAGFIKLLYNRRRLAGFIKKEQLEAGQKEEIVELTQREKDEGDLFGIRAIEAGFFAGVAQSRPTSRAGSVMDVSVASSHTLTGGATSPFMKNNMANNSALSLNFGSSRDSDTLGDNESRRPAIKLRPSEAELSGRLNHNGAVDMTLNVPPSPGYRRSHSGGFGGSDDGESDGFTSPRSVSPSGAQSNPRQYFPVSGTTQELDSNARSQAASFNTLSPLGSPNLPSPGNPPETRLPTLPGTALRKEFRSPSPQGNPSVRVEQPHPEVGIAFTPSKHPHPQVFSSTNPHLHHREGSGASSLYSLTQSSSNQPYVKYSDRVQQARSTAPLRPDHPDRSQIPSSVEKKAPPAPSQTNALLAPGADAAKDTRLSEFYEAYYRNSQLNFGLASDPS